MLYRERIAVCSQIHTKHINTLCGQNVELLLVKLAVHIVTTGLWRVRNERTRYAHYTDAVHTLAAATLQVSITDWTPDSAAGEGQRTAVSTGMLNGLDVCRGRSANWVNWQAGRQSVECCSHPPAARRVTSVAINRVWYHYLLCSEWDRDKPRAERRNCCSSGKGRLTHSMPCPCRSPAMPCR